MLQEAQTIKCKNCVFSSLRNVFLEDDYCLIEENKGEMNYHAGDIIVKQGNFVSQLHYLKTGLVKIIFEEKNGKSTVLNLVEEGEFIGLNSFFESDKYAYTIIAQEDCTVCAIRKESFSAIMQRNEEAKLYLLRKFQEELVFLYKRIAVLSTRNSYGKLTTTLLYLQEAFKRPVLQNVSRKELAKIATISVESANKILSELKNDGMIELSNSGIKLLKPELLKMLSTVG